MEKTIICLNEPFTAKLRLDFKNGVNYIGIDMPNTSAFAKLTNDQVRELIKFLNEWKGSVNESNCGHMVEVEMSEDKAEQQIIEIESKHERDVWNAAIDKCIEVANKYDSYGPAYEMRMLKK